MLRAKLAQSFCRIIDLSQRAILSFDLPGVDLLIFIVLSAMLQGTNKAIVFTLFAALTWPDTASVNKVTKLIPLVVEQVL